MQTPALLPGFFISLFSLSSHLPCDRISVLAAIVCVDVLLLFQLSGVALPILEALPIIFRSVNGNFSSVPATFPTALINFPGGNIYMFRHCMRVLRNMSWRLFPTKHESIPLRPLLPCLRHTRIRDGLHCYLSHGWREGWWRCPFPWPDVSRWCNLGELDSVRIAVHGEYYRFSTALTLHQDTPHLWGNVLFSLIFLPLLARASGTGHALLICLLGGSIGNAANYLFRQHAFISLGFSTALFAGLGALSGIATLYQRKKALIPLAAGMALLSMLGTGGEDVDYLAHCCGFGAGFFLGVLEGWQSRHRLRWRLPQSIACLLVILLLLLAWWLAFRV